MIGTQRYISFVVDCATRGELVWHEWMIWGAKHGFRMRDQHSYYAKCSKNECICPKTLMKKNYLSKKLDFNF